MTRYCAKAEPEVVLRTGRFFSSRTLSWRHPNFRKPKSPLGTHSVLSISANFKIHQNFSRAEVVLRTGRFFSSRTLSWRHPNFRQSKSSLGTHSVLSILYSKGAKVLAPFEYVIYEDNQIGFRWWLWPCGGRRPESDPAGGAIGNWFGYRKGHQNFCHSL